MTTPSPTNPNLPAPGAGPAPQPTPKLRVIEYDEWAEEFKPRGNLLQKDGEDGPHNGTLYETFGAELQAVLDADPALVWTLMDDGTLGSGYHLVNRMGYFICQKPLVGGFVEVVDEPAEWLKDYKTDILDGSINDRFDLSPAMAREAEKIRQTSARRKRLHP
jgi:hypothetical protein